MQKHRAVVDSVRLRDSLSPSLIDLDDARGGLNFITVPLVTNDGAYAARAHPEGVRVASFVSALSTTRVTADDAVAGPQLVVLDAGNTASTRARGT